MFKYFVIVSIFNTGICWLSLWRKNWRPIVIRLINTGWTCTLNPKNETDTFSDIWIQPVMITQRNIIPFYNFILLSCNWVMRKISIIPRYVEFVLLHIFYVLNMIIAGGKLVISLEFIYLCIYIV